ncbi:recombinase family protein [Clostridioides difficile]|nr:recombinase family protein [Clostridioides difficile]MCW0602345.1 recombinase family protein [Clostridioides difficile]
MLRVALYIRVSTEEQVLNGDSIRTQIEALEQYSKENDFNIVDKYVDEGFSATNLKRPNLQRLLKDVEANKVDLVLLTKIDRLSRGVKNYYKILEILEKHKCDWKTILENYDSSTAAGRLHINIMLSVAENEAAQTSERIKFVFQDKLRRKEVISGTVPTGYKIENKHLAIDEEKEYIVKSIFDEYEKSGSVRTLIETINNLYGELYSYNKIKNILRNELYIGIYNKRGFYVEDYCEPIISKEQFQRIQRILEKNKKTTPNKNRYYHIFSGLLKCKECGRTLKGNSGNVREKLYLSYRCSTFYLNKNCIHNVTHNEKHIENYLLTNLKPQLHKHMVKLETQNEKIRQSKKSNKKDEKKKIKKKLDKIKDLYLEDLIDKETYRKDYEKLQSQLDNITEEQESQIIDTSYIKKFLDIDINEMYKNLSRVECRRFWLSIIDYIEIDNNKNITINFI